jgi:FdhD protein
MLGINAMPSIATTTVFEWNDGRRRTVLDDLAGEDPLEIRVAGAPVSVTMRTPGHDLDLAAGFLITEGVIQAPGQLEALEADRNHVIATLSPDAPDPSRLRRSFFTSSSCGVCGRASLESLRLRGLERPARTLTLEPDLLCALPGRLLDGQRVFTRTGGLHAAGLVDARGDRVVLREDVGRHNAVDKVVGWALRHGRLPLTGHLLMVSGRGGFEIVQKAIVAGIEAVACISAPSSLGVQLAREYGLTLIGFLRQRRFVVYAGEGRIR